MQAVILSAGRGIRMKELTAHTPKPLLRVAGRPLLQYALDALPDNVDEVVISVGYLGNMIREHFGSEYHGKRLLYAEQENLNGTAGALWLAKPFLKNSFLVMHADNIYAREDVARAARVPWSIVGLEVDNLGQAAKLIVDTSDRVMDILEVGDYDKSPGFLNTGLYCLDTRVFDYPMVPKSPGSEEYGLPQTLIKTNIPLHLIEGTYWFEITSPEDIKKVEEILAKNAISDVHRISTF